MLGNTSLSRSVLSGSASAGPMDNNNMDMIQFRTGGVFNEGDDVANLYNSTGNLRVARTLNDYRKARAQKGMQGSVYGVRDEKNPGRVFRDEADKALQAKNEGSGSDFQEALKSNEARAAADPNHTEFDWNGQRIAVGQGAGGGAGDGGAGAGAGAGDASAEGMMGTTKENPFLGVGGVDERFRTLSNQLDPKGSFTEQGAKPGTSEVAEEGGQGGYNWWDANKRGLGNAFGDAVEGYANIFPHLSNIKDYKELDGIIAPMLQRGVPLERPNLDSYKQSIIAQGRNMQNQAGYDSAQSGAQAGTRAAALAKTQSELSRLAGYEGNLRSDIANKERVINSKIDNANISTINDYYTDVTERSLYQTQGIANERNQIANNILGFTGGQRQRKLDRERMQLTYQEGNFEGVLDRQAIDYYNANNEWPSYVTNKMVKDFYG